MCAGTRSTHGRCLPVQPGTLQHLMSPAVHNPTLLRFRTISRVLLSCLFLALVGCAIVKPVWYQTQPDDPEQTVVITLSGMAYIESLDGKRLAEPLETWNGGYAAVREIRILPGDHTVDGSVYFNNVRADYSFRENFAPGRYEISANVQGYQVEPQLKRLENQ